MVLIITKLDIGTIVTSKRTDLRKIEAIGLKHVDVDDYSLVPLVISDHEKLTWMDVDEASVQIRRDLTDFNLARNIQEHGKKLKKG